MSEEMTHSEYSDMAIQAAMENIPELSVILKTLNEELVTEKGKAAEREATSFAALISNAQGKISEIQKDPKEGKYAEVAVNDLLVSLNKLQQASSKQGVERLQENLLKAMAQLFLKAHNEKMLDRLDTVGALRALAEGLNRLSLKQSGRTFTEDEKKDCLDGIEQSLKQVLIMEYLNLHSPAIDIEKLAGDLFKSDEISHEDFQIAKKIQSNMDVYAQYRMKGEARDNALQIVDRYPDALKEAKGAQLQGWMKKKYIDQRARGSQPTSYEETMTTVLSQNLPEKFDKVKKQLMSELETRTDLTASEKRQVPDMAAINILEINAKPKSRQWIKAVDTAIDKVRKLQEAVGHSEHSRELGHTRFEK